jgi:hypothetical protein
MQAVRQQEIWARSSSLVGMRRKSLTWLKHAFEGVAIED